jgi:hypothetical protein
VYLVCIANAKINRFGYKLVYRYIKLAFGLFVVIAIIITIAIIILILAF